MEILQERRRMLTRIITEKKYFGNAGFPVLYLAYFYISINAFSFIRVKTMLEEVKTKLRI